MIDLWIQCWRGKKHYPNTSSSFRRLVDWPSVPPDGALILVGRDANGEECGINAYVSGVYWQANGILVEAHIEELDATDEFDSVRESLVLDGFEWKHGESMPCSHPNIRFEWRDTHKPDAPPTAYGQWNVCEDCGHEWKGEE